MGPKNIKWWKCKGDMKVEYRERVRRKYEDLDAEMGTLDGEWRHYKDAFVGVAGSCVVERRGKEADSNDGGRKRWRGQWGRSGKHTI